MSADVRALLKAKTQERAKRIVHPFAAYNNSGQLRCTLCATIVKDNEIIWSGHLGSKGHRTNVGRQKELAKKEEERMRLEKGKRKATPDQNDSGANGSDADMDVNGSGHGNAAASKRQKTEEEQRPSAALSSNFFSDPTRSLPTRDNEDEDENDGNIPRSNPPGTLTNKPTPSQIDLEWAQFERDVLAKPAQSSLNPNETSLSKKEIYDRATVVMEEEVRYDMNGTDGFPDHLQSGTSNGNNARTGAGARIEGEYVGGAPLEDETPEQMAARKAQEEKELIMDRILDEERAQEDADEKVRAIKARLALVRKKREDEKRRKAAGGVS